MRILRRINCGKGWELDKISVKKNSIDRRVFLDMILKNLDVLELSLFEYIF